MDEAILGILEILEAAKTSAGSTAPIKKINGFYYGDPILIPASNLPAIVVMPVSDSVTARGTAYDQSDIRIRIKLVQNLKDEMGNTAAVYNSGLTKNAVDLFQERDENRKLKPESIVGAMRSKPGLPYNGVKSVDWDGQYNITYDFTEIRGYIAFESNLNIMAKIISDRI